MPPRLVVLSKPRGSNTFPAHLAIAPVTSLFATLTHSPHQYHCKDFSLPLFSYSYALFCTVRSQIHCIFNALRTLCAKHPGWGMPVRVPTIHSTRFDRFTLLRLYSLLFFREDPCTRR